MPVTVYSVLLLAFEVPMYIWHLSVMWMLSVMIRRRHPLFSFSFYYVIVLIGFADIWIFLFNTVFAFRLPSFGFFRGFYLSNGWIAVMDYITSGCLTYIQFFGHIVIAFNRFTLLWFPKWHRMIWKVDWYIPAILIITLLLQCQFFTLSGHFQLLRTGELNGRFNDPSLELAFLKQISVVYPFAALLAFIFGILIAFKYFQLRNQKKLNRLGKHDQRLLLYSIILFAAQLLRTANIICQLIFSSDASLTKFIQSFIVEIIDIYAWIGSISLIILSKNVRKTYMAYYFNHQGVTFHTHSVSVISPSSVASSRC